MKEIRLHGRGGQGTVKASEIIVQAAVNGGLYACAIPFFGFERSGAPVSAFVRIDEDVIWPKTQVYQPDCVMIMDATLRSAVPLFEGIREGASVVVNAADRRVLDTLDIPGAVACVGWVDARTISTEVLGRNLPNTTMLGAFARTTGLVDVQHLAQLTAEIFAPANADAVRRGYEEAEVLYL